MSRHVIFDNNTFPYESNRPSESPLASSHLLQTSSRIPRFAIGLPQTQSLDHMLQFLTLNHNASLNIQN